MACFNKKVVTSDKAANKNDVKKMYAEAKVEKDQTKQSNSMESTHIYSNVPFESYLSSYCSPKINKRRDTFRESRRVSVEQSEGFLQLNQYKLLEQIGQGSYGLVKLAYSEEDSTYYAMKILSKRRLLRQAGLMKRGPKRVTSPLDRVYHEIAVLKKLNHPNVVKLIEVLDDPAEDSLYMVFEWVKHGAVLNIPTKTPLTEDYARKVFRDTLKGLEYLHYQKIIHFDLKPDNILLTENGQVKIADLGVCNEFVGENATMTNGCTAGTPAFRAPETLTTNQNTYCGRAADIWSLGATLFSLVYGNIPFIAESIPDMYDKIRCAPLIFPNTSLQISGALKDCIERMLQKDPTKRITLKELKEHTWVTNNGLKSLPTEEENCHLVEVNSEEICNVVRSIPKLDTLILIKTMLKKHSFGNPFIRNVFTDLTTLRESRLKLFAHVGRSQSAPAPSYKSIDVRFNLHDNGVPTLPEALESSYANATNM